jgi:hypothetical protein
VQLACWASAVLSWLGLVILSTHKATKHYHATKWNDTCSCVLQEVPQGPDAVPDSATTESDSVSDVQLLRSGGDERTLFKLTLQVRRQQGPV